MKNLIVGLGNPTSKYARNRHNIGFMIVDHLANKLDLQFSNSKLNSLIATYKDNLLIKPTTFMNESGIAVQAVLQFYKPENILVIHDELDLPFMTLRYKSCGSSGGHNGLKSIEKHCGGFDRMRFGITHAREIYPNLKREDAVIKHVLSDFSTTEFAQIMPLFDLCDVALLDYMEHSDILRLQNKYSFRPKNDAN